jgi:hypothetical protein
MSLTKHDIITNWDSYYKSYLKLNSDLEFSGIITKRALLNHFIKYGYNEGRKVSDNIDFNLSPQVDTEVHLDRQVIKSNKFYLEERMIIEKID